MSLSKPFLSPGTCSHGTERHSLAEAAPALPTIQRGFPNRITVGAWGSETFYVVGPALGTAGCLATAWSLPEERQYHPSTRDSQNVPTQPRAPGLWEVRVTHRKKVDNSHPRWVRASPTSTLS